GLQGFFCVLLVNRKNALNASKCGESHVLLHGSMVGGDNASRGMAIGMVLGAYKGVEAIPQAWRETLNQWQYCDDLLQCRT
ncbi:MAG: ADP-ribosylglycohydrolase family protein, partial [Luteolibacter sp.]